MADRGIDVPDVLRDELANTADGDGRRVLNLLEIAVDFQELKQFS